MGLGVFCVFFSKHGETQYIVPTPRRCYCKFCSLFFYSFWQYMLLHHYWTIQLAPQSGTAHIMSSWSYIYWVGCNVDGSSWQVWAEFGTESIKMKPHFKGGQTKQDSLRCECSIQNDFTLEKEYFKTAMYLLRQFYSFALLKITVSQSWF